MDRAAGATGADGADAAHGRDKNSLGNLKGHGERLWTQHLITKHVKETVSRTMCMWCCCCFSAYEPVCKSSNVRTCGGKVL